MNQPLPRPLATGPASHPVSGDDILALRRWVWRDGLINRSEADTILAINAAQEQPSSAWTEFFVEAIAVWLVDQQEPRGYIDEDDADWLIGKLVRADGSQTTADLELVIRVLEKAISAPQRLRTFALRAIERAIAGSGRPRGESVASPTKVTADDSRLLRRLLFAPAGDRPAGVSAAEADLLFRIKDATLAADNDPEWQRLFVQGVGNYLQGLGGCEPIARERALELKRFMAEPSGLECFLSRLGRGDTGAVAGDRFRAPDAAHDWNTEVERAAAIDPAEKAWLDARIHADNAIDDYERALLAFLAGR